MLGLGSFSFHCESKMYRRDRRPPIPLLEEFFDFSKPFVKPTPVKKSAENEEDVDVDGDWTREEVESAEARGLPMRYPLQVRDEWAQKKDYHCAVKKLYRNFAVRFEVKDTKPRVVSEVCRGMKYPMGVRMKFISDGDALERKYEDMRVLFHERDFFVVERECDDTRDEADMRAHNLGKFLDFTGAQHRYWKNDRANKKRVDAYLERHLE